MKVVILAGGKGLRMSEYNKPVPKPMVEIGGEPLLWHVAQIYASQGFDDIIVASGYLHEVIEKWFAANRVKTRGVNITVVSTGDETYTGGRIKKVAQAGGLTYGDPFFVTYADGLANIDLNELHYQALQKGTMATLTAVLPRSQFGTVKISEEGLVTGFEEKPLLPDFVNGGFFWFDWRILDALTVESDLERETLPLLARFNQLAAYKHEGFWRQCDTPKDVVELNDLWRESKPWLIQ